MKQMNKQQSKHILFEVDSELYKKLKIMAIQNNTTLKGWLLEAINQKIDESMKQQSK